MLGAHRREPWGELRTGVGGADFRQSVVTDAPGCIGLAVELVVVKEDVMAVAGQADVDLGPPAVIDDVIRLHRRDHAQIGKLRIILRPEVLTQPRTFGSADATAQTHALSVRRDQTD